MDKEMMKALMADGEKLRAMTGEDHGPYFLFDEEGDIEADWFTTPPVIQPKGDE